MATVTIVDDQKSESPEPQKIDTNVEKAVEMGMAAEFGAMKQKFQDLESTLSARALAREAERAEREADRAEIRSAHQRIAELETALEEEEEDLEEVEAIKPPPVEEKPKEDEKPKRQKTFLQKCWLGW